MTRPTDSELEVLVRILHGKKVHEIAKELELAESTVSTLKARGLSKIGHIPLHIYFEEPDAKKFSTNKGVSVAQDSLIKNTAGELRNALKNVPNDAELLVTSSEDVPSGYMSVHYDENKNKTWVVGSYKDDA